LGLNAETLRNWFCQRASVTVGTKAGPVRAYSAIRESPALRRGNSIGCAAPKAAIHSVKHRVCRVCDPRSKLSAAPLRDLVDVELISTEAQLPIPRSIGRRPAGRLTAPERA
jgi:hypothetical protein